MSKLYTLIHLGVLAITWNLGVYILAELGHLGPRRVDLFSLVMGVLGIIGLTIYMV